MELEESIKHIEDIIDWHWKNSPDRCYVMGNKDFDAFTTIIKYIKEESIPKAVVEEKIKAKIEELKDGTFDAKIVLQSLLEKE